MAKKPTLHVSALPAETKLAFFPLLEQWFKQATIAAAAVALENELRLQVVALAFPGATEGTTTMELGHGKQLKLDTRINRSVDRTQYEGLKSFIDSFVDDGSDPEKTAKVRRLQGIIDSCVSLKPEVVVSGYKELSDDDKLLVADVFTEKPGTPGLTIHTPPAK